MNTFAQWEDEESKLEYQGQLRKEEILKIADQLVSPRRQFNDKVYQAASLDLTVGAIFTQKDGKIYQIGPSTNPNVDLPDDEQPSISLKAGEVAIVVTREEISLPRNIVANSLPVMSRTRDGILVLSHGHIDPGFRGYLIVRLLNMSSRGYPLRLGARIITLTLVQLPSKAERYTDLPKDLPTVVDESRKSVEQTFPAAVLLDVQGSGFQKLIESAVAPLIKRLQRKARIRLVIAVIVAAAFGAFLAAEVVPAVTPIVEGYLNHLK